MPDALIRQGAELIDLGTAAVVVIYVIRAVLALAKSGPDGGRLVMAEGVLTALGFSVAATLLKALGLRTWHQIGLFTFVLAFRTAMKYVFSAEKSMLARSLQIRRSGTKT